MLDQSFIKENITRLREIARILSRYEMEDVAEKLHLPAVFFKENSKKKYTQAEKIKLILQELGPTFIKFGQALSCHPDILPKDIIRELEQLQDKTDPFPFSYVEKKLLQSFNKPIPELFLEFNPTPFASASIAQVHHAKLHSGERVVV
jgi:ubiquinone biosynthesis protein